MRLLLDASVAIAYLDGEPGSPEIRRWVRRAVESGDIFLVPSHFWLETVNVLGVAKGRPSTEVLQALHTLRGSRSRRSSSTRPASCWSWMRWNVMG